MSFLTPWFLAGVAAVGLPLWLHLLEKQNPVRIPFSSLMFFQRRTERSVRHRRLRYLLLLASRVALIFFLALLFARPVFKRSAAAALASSHNRIIAIDTSFSMQYGDRWQRAQTQALALVDGLGSGDRAQVIAFGPKVRLLNDSTSDRAVLRSSIVALKPTTSRNSYGELGQSLRTLAQNTPLPAEVHVISDFQQSAMPGRFADLSLPATASLNAHNVVSEGAKNWCVESVKGETHLYEKARPRLEVTVAGFSTPAASRKVTLKINGREIASKPVAVPESGRATVVFTDFDVPHGNSRGEVRIDAADGLPGDDVRLVAFERSDPLPILFVHQPGRTLEMLYYKTALDASGQSMFTVQAATPGDMASFSPERYAFIVLSDVSRLPAQVEQRLKTFVESGGAVLLVAGSSIALDGSIPLLGRRATDTQYNPRQGPRFQQVGEIDSAHPVVRSSKRFAGVKFFRYLRWEAPADRVLARLADGSPLIVDENLGAGHILVLTSPLDNVWNDFPVHPLFVPFVAESARYLSGLEETMVQTTVDSILELQRRRDPRASVEVLDPAGKRALDLTAAVTGKELILGSTGFYEVRRAGDIELIAVNPDPRESDLRAMPDDVLAMWKSTGRPEPGSPAAAAASAQPVNQDFWRFLLLVALAVAVLESVIGNLHLGIQREVQSE